MKKIAVVSFSDLASDPRVNRQIRFLKDSYHLTAVGFGDPELDDVAFIRIPGYQLSLSDKVLLRLRMLAKRYEADYWGSAVVRACLERTADLTADLFIANDIETLPVTLRMARGAKVLFDAHEYAPKQFEDRWSFRVFFQDYRTYLCKRYIPQSAAMTTVCRGIADAYGRDVGVKPVVITNAPDYEALQPRLGEATKIRLVHHGAAIPSRRIETMLELMDYLDSRFELDLMLMPTSEKYLHYLQNLAQGKPNIRFLPPVPMRSLPRVLNDYDIGLFLLEPVNFNYRHALPNKFFEFIQGRLAVAIGPSPEMARLVREHDLGVVGEDFSPQSLAHQLNGLTQERINRYKRNAHSVAHLMSAKRNEAMLNALVRQVLACS